MLSQGNLLFGEWRLHPKMVEQIRHRHGGATVDPVASQENDQSYIFFSVKDEGAPLELDTLAHPWPSALLYAFPPLNRMQTAPFFTIKVYVAMISTCHIGFGGKPPGATSSGV